MANTVAQKLKIRPGDMLKAINPPREFESGIGALPAGARISSDPSAPDQIHWFVLTRDQMEHELDGIFRILKNDMICWIYYPKGTSKIQTDLTRDKGWDKLLKNKNLQWLSLISFDSCWSAFAVRLKTGSDEKKVSKSKERPILQYIDPVKKEVHLPRDLGTAMKANKKALNAFKNLSFTNKKEYVEWVVTAKKDETRQERLRGTIERLEKGWKNPRNI
ncbi:MAG TPA: YdeI/OmpD-associated family protein [Puia sp.]|nr:YdeI/OmpD-associated family protein [Puia sp.]